jgi:ADP-ribose pyrophosphatase YjhB (NUDIX family)
MPQEGLPEPIFLLVSRLTPLLSVDLLIRDDNGRTLLTWREDHSYGPGWHVPGGIVRYRESVATRIHEVARLELGARVEFEETPLSILESLRDSARDRAHTISMLYQCRLLTWPNESLRVHGGAPRPGYWQWHSTCPKNLIPEQRPYESYLG